jgi:hypothetical protein
LWRRIDEESFQEWQYTRAKILKENMLIEEKNPNAMLPSPLNIFPMIASPFHVYHLRTYLIPRLSNNPEAKVIVLSFEV